MKQIPSSLSDYIGQEKHKKNLLLQIEAARMRKDSVSHFLMSGPDSMGKSTLASIAAQMLGVHTRTVDCGERLKFGDVAAILTHLRMGDFLFLENVELLKEDVVGLLAETMENFVLDIIVGKGNTTKEVRLNLPHFTAVGLSSRPRQINKKLQRLFLFNYEFEPYDVSEISQLIYLFIRDHKQNIAPTAANLLAVYCKGTIDDARNIARKVADYCLVKFSSPEIDYGKAITALGDLGYLSGSDSSAQIVDTLCKMNGTEFEEFLADLFSKIGYKVELTQTSGDHGIDLFLKRANENVAVQCKRWSKPVGEPIIRDFYGSLIHSGISKGIVVTTATFTPQAHSFVEKKPIALLDIDKLVELVRRYYVRRI